MALVNQPQETVLTDDEIAAELGSVIAVRVVELTMFEPAFNVEPHHARMPGAPARTFELVGAIDAAVMVEQHRKCAANLVHPLLQCGKRAK